MRAWGRASGGLPGAARAGCCQRKAAGEVEEGVSEVRDIATYAELIGEGGECGGEGCAPVGKALERGVGMRAQSHTRVRRP